MRLHLPVAALCISLTGIAPALAQTPATAVPVTVVMTSASSMTQGMALVLATQMRAQGASVDILLCDQAADIALQDAGGVPLKPQGATPAQMLDAAMARGVTASVCALYPPNSGNPPARLRTGIEVARPDAMARTLLQAERRVLAF